MKYHSYTPVFVAFLFYGCLCMLKENVIVLENVEFNLYVSDILI